MKIDLTVPNDTLTDAEWVAYLEDLAIEHNEALRKAQEMRARIVRGTGKAVS